MMNKKIIFLTGTRADFGKLKGLMHKVEEHDDFELHIFVTGMHMIAKFGYTCHEVEKECFRNIYKYINQNSQDSMDIILAKTIHGLSDFIKEINPDLLVVHGDRVEALAGAIVGSLNNILVAHIEGGELSGTVDELIRHSVSKMAHAHFVANKNARERLIQLGELDSSIKVIGSPDLDIMLSRDLPSLSVSKKRYDICFEKYSIAMLHPVTTKIDEISSHCDIFIDALMESDRNYIVIFPNNDLGHEEIIKSYQRIEGHPNFKIYPSLKFEHFLTLMKHAEFMIGNSSAGVRGCPFYGVPSINIGCRQSDRSNAGSIQHCEFDKQALLDAIMRTNNYRQESITEFGNGSSHELFIREIECPEFWCIPKQKKFVDI